MVASFPADPDPKLRVENGHLYTPMPGAVLVVSVRLGISHHEMNSAYDGYARKNPDEMSQKEWMKCEDFPEQRPFDERTFVAVLHVDFDTGAANLAWFCIQA